MLADESAVAERWAEHMKKGKKLPKRKHPVTNGRIARLDPSRTITLRRQFQADLARRFTKLRQEIFQLLVDEDALGLKERKPFTFNAEGRWLFHTADQKVSSFLQWLKQRIVLHLVGEHLDENAWWNRYIVDGFRRGAARAFDDTRPQVREWQDSPEAKRRLSFYNGTREEFLRSSFNWPTSREKVKLLASRTFTDLKGVTDGMAARISHTLVDGLTKGDNPRVIAKELAKNVNVGKVRAQTIARTEVIRTHAEGQLQAFEQLGVTEVGVMAEWSTAQDDRVCDVCQPLDGVVLKVSEATGLLPRHPNCLPGDSLILSRSQIAATSERWYTGDLIVIHTASGRELSCTPNHPVLTNLGWVPANSIDIGSYIVRDGGSEWESVSDDQNENIPTSIENVSCAFRKSGEVLATKVPLTTPNFHGDAIDGQVAVIWANRRLLLSDDTSIAEHSHELQFIVGDVKSGIGLPRLGSQKEFILTSGNTANSIMSGLSLFNPSNLAHLGPLEKFCLALRSYMYPSSFKYATNYSSADLEAIRNLQLSLPTNVELNDDFIMWTSCNLSILPTLDNVVSVDSRRYDGHVYNLQTKEGWYSANGIITHNCRCAWLPANVGEDESNQKRSKGIIGKVIDSSYKAEMPKVTKRTLAEQKAKSSWGGADKTISKARPTSVLKRR